MEPENPIAAYNDFLHATLEKETEARTLLNSLHPDEAVSEEEVFQVAQVLAITEWTSEGFPLVLGVAKQRHDLRGIVDDLAISGLCLCGESRSTLVERIDAIVKQFNVVCARAKEK